VRTATIPVFGTLITNTTMKEVSRLYLFQPRLDINVWAAAWTLISSLPAPNFQPTATQEWDGPCGNQHYSCELLMMGIIVSETC